MQSWARQRAEEISGPSRLATVASVTRRPQCLRDLTAVQPLSTSPLEQKRIDRQSSAASDSRRGELHGRTERVAFGNARIRCSGGPSHNTLLREATMGTESSIERATLN